MSDRAALTGILFVLKTGISWEYLPAEMGCGNGITRWPSLRDSCQMGVWRRLHQVLLEALAQADHIGWDRAALDSATVLRNGLEPNGSRQDPEGTPHEAPLCGRRPRHPARGPGERGERARFEPRNRQGRHPGWSLGRSPGSSASRDRSRYEHRADIHPAFLQLDCALISLSFLGEPRSTRENGRPGPPRTASAILGT